MITAYTYAFDRNNEPAARAKSGDTLTFETLDCFSNQVQCDSHLVSAIDFNRTNPATGPVYVEGAEVGDVLKVEIKSINVGPQGAVTTLPKVGPLHEVMETRTKILEVKDGQTTFNGLTFPVRPMIGVIGVAPAEGAVPCGFPGNHGGNLDAKIIEAGAIVYLPVRAPGALLQMGDLHAVMGDSELCGTGLEIAGQITVTISVIKNCPLVEWPVVETKDKWYAMASDLDYTQALKEVSLQMQKLMTKVYGWDATDVYLYLSLQGDVEINQGCQPCPVPMILRLGIPKQPNKPLIS